MPVCSAPNCSNRTERGYRLFRFPLNTRRRAIWIQNCGRGEWLPNQNSRLCEAHFEENEFETIRKSGWYKLKRTAIPTLFDVTNAPKGNLKGQKSDCKIVERNEDSAATNVALVGKRLGRNYKYKRLTNVDKSSVKNSPIDDKSKLSVLEEENRKLKSILAKSLLENRQLSDKFTELLRDHEEKKTEVETILSSFLTEDQILSLGKKKMKQWSDRTIMKAFEIRKNLGIHGYNYICEIGYPLPSIRTLYSRLEEYNIAPEVLRNLPRHNISSDDILDDDLIMTVQ